MWTYSSSMRLLSHALQCLKHLTFKTCVVKDVIWVGSDVGIFNRIGFIYIYLFS